jgi:glyoxylase-like metal-dependent hydrolase (beta-lactamase superfamily II)
LTDLEEINMKKLMKSLMGLSLVAMQAMAVSACSSGSSSVDENSGSGPLALEVFTADEASLDVTSAVISGEREAILVDAQFTRSQAKLLSDKIAESGKELTTIYITHAHPDHSFGLEVVHQRFPGARIIARAAVVDEMKAAGPAKIEQWKPVFNDDLTDTLVDIAPYDGDTLTLEGHEVRILGPLQGDTEHVFPVYVPELKAVIAGDAVYNGVHVWLAETGSEQRKAWVETMKTLAALRPEIVVAGHKNPELADGPEAIEQTSAYIEEYDRVVAESASAEEAEQKMLAKYGALGLPLVLKLSTQAAFNQPAP